MLIVMNAGEISQAEQTNRENVTLRAIEQGKEDGNPEQYADVEVPEKKVAEQPCLFNPFDAKYCFIGDANMITVWTEDGKQMTLVNEQEVFDEIAEAIDLKSKKDRKEIADSLRPVGKKNHEMLN